MDVGTNSDTIAPCQNVHPRSKDRFPANVRRRPEPRRPDDDIVAGHPRQAFHRQSLGSRVKVSRRLYAGAFHIRQIGLGPEGLPGKRECHSAQPDPGEGPAVDVASGFIHVVFDLH